MTGKFQQEKRSAEDGSPDAKNKIETKNVRQEAQEESSTEQNRIKKGYEWSSAYVYTERKTKQVNVEKERKKKRYVLEIKLGCRNEEETEQILPV